MYPPREPFNIEPLLGWLMVVLCLFALGFYTWAEGVKHSVLTGGSAVKGDVSYDPRQPTPWIMQSTQHRSH